MTIPSPIHHSFTLFLPTTIPSNNEKTSVTIPSFLHPVPSNNHSFQQ